jgi:uncharacterized membrane protein YoaK (UPF0700 family)
MKKISNTISMDSVITGLSTLILGFLNAYSAIFNHSTLISAQTGNLVNLGIELSRGQIHLLADNLCLLLGFAAGCGLGAVFISKCQKNRLFGWSLFSAIIWLSTLLSPWMTANHSVVVFSFLSGIALTFFRNFEKSNLNNGIMTGNLKNFYAYVVNFLLRNKKEELKLALDILILVFLFFLGSFLGGAASSLGKGAMLTAVSLSCLIPYIIFWLKGENVKK